MEHVSIIQKRWQCLTGNQIKIVGIILMVFDHLHQMFYMQGAPLWFHLLGRPVAPIFIFMCAEGFYHTRSRKNYMFLLLLGSLFMSIASTMIAKVMPNDKVMLINNIFMTLFLITVYLFAIEMMKSGIKEKKTGKILASIGVMLLPLLISGIAMFVLLPAAEKYPLLLQGAFMIPNFIMAEGGVIFVLMGILFYLFRKNRIAQVLVLCLISVIIFLLGSKDQALMGTAAILMLLYNGERGTKSVFSKYFFYLFYPAHIYLFYIISTLFCVK